MQIWPEKAENKNHYKKSLACSVPLTFEETWQTSETEPCHEFTNISHLPS